MSEKPRTEPEGYVLVPLEPTEAMLNAGDQATWEPSSDRPYAGTAAVRDAWKAMIEEWKNERG